ncbi:acyltransferase family protein [Spirosoma radiotolerans]|uniref:N-acetylglucosamine related transporter, NagX n=1 Tax=Spirosoma radiotolerans TaxID=1379870 RepID=A0A0E3VAI4_9BACT|nr:heparan-alpha-glucosaminide N-acetyltransferase domain-containing protein [Spirosoma radiotolerans]AKD58131.1 N-acetylglucosamine related transporter, NagX [Spirosoma radiotolerans]
MQSSLSESQSIRQPKTSTSRLLSLDFFRGLTVAAMVLVNNPGDWGHIYAPLEHAPWNGWTPTDLIFPFFLFIVGVSITFALDGRKKDGKGVIGKIVRRSATLFLLGFFLNFFPKFDITTVRIFGVLQRIALVYLVCSLIFLKTTPRQQVYIGCGLLVGYWLLMTLVPVPGVGFANLEPATNLAAWFDKTIITPAHVYKPAKVWDPEGLLSTLPAIVTGLIGIQTGMWLRNTRPVAEKIAWLFAAGCLLTLGGLIWDGFFPINKALWTSSYVLLAGGLAMLGLALCYWLIDVQGYRRGVLPFVAFGVNAITVFFLSGLIPRIMNLIRITQPDGTEIGSKEYLYRTFIAPPFADPKDASLAGALTFVLIWFGILWWMYRKNVIIKV